MERKRSCSSEEDSPDLKKCRKKFTEVESFLIDDTRDKYFDDPLSDEYQPQFFNYQLIGDRVAVAILNSKDLIIKRGYYVPVEAITRRRFCSEAWTVQDLLLEMKSKKSRYPIAKKVILSVGYNDCCSNLMNPDMFVECVEKTIKKLHRRGCKEIILTNVPPCGMECDDVNHWKYLQIINEEIFKLSEKHYYIGHCDIFKLFCRPKNLFSSNKDYVLFSEINYKVDFAMYNEGELHGQIDLINFSNMAKIVLGKHVAKTVEKRMEYLRRGQIDKVICVLEEASDVDDSDSEDEAVVIVLVDDADECGAVINLDSPDDDDAVGNCLNDSDIQLQLSPENTSLKQEISTVIKNPDDIHEEERSSCEMPPENQRMKPVISCSNVKSVDDIKKEKTCEMFPEEEQVKQAISIISIKSVDDIEKEKTCEVSPEEERTKQAILVSIESVDHNKNEKTFCNIPPEEDSTNSSTSSSIKIVSYVQSEEPAGQFLPEEEGLNQVISCTIESVSFPEDERLSCTLSQKNENIKQKINDIEELFRKKREIVPNMEITEPIKHVIVDNIERSEPSMEELVSSTEKSELVKQEIISNIEESEPLELMVSSVQKSKPVKQEIVSITERSDNIKDKKLLSRIPEEDGRLKQVIFCNFKNLDSEIEKPSCEIPEEDSQTKPVILSCFKKFGSIKAEKPSDEMHEKNLPLQQVISCSIQRFNVKEEKSSLKREK